MDKVQSKKKYLRQIKGNNKTKETAKQEKSKNSVTREGYTFTILDTGILEIKMNTAMNPLNAIKKELIEIPTEGATVNLKLLEPQPYISGILAKYLENHPKVNINICCKGKTVSARENKTSYELK